MKTEAQRSKSFIWSTSIFWRGSWQLLGRGWRGWEGDMKAPTKASRAAVFYLLKKILGGYSKVFENKDDHWRALFGKQKSPYVDFETNATLDVILVVVVQLLSHAWLFAIPWTAARQASLSFTISWGLLKTHVYWVDDAIQPSLPLLLPPPIVFNLSQHQGLSHWVSFSHHVAKVLELQLQHHSFQWIFRVEFC